MALGHLSEPNAAQCSRAACVADPSWRVNWRNPKVHAPDRVKVWLACDEHRDYLSEFVNARGFLLSVEPFEVDQ